MYFIQRLRYLSRPFQGVLIGVLCALLVQGILAQGWLRGMERGSLDSLFRLRGAQRAAPQVVLVIADEATVERYNSWPLPRRAHAALVQRLSGAGAKTIAYDLLFTSPSTPAEDAEFMRACREAGNVVLSGVFQMPEGDTLSATDVLPLGAAKQRHEPDLRFAIGGAETTQSAANLPRSLWFSAPLPALTRTARRVGHVNFQPGRDGTMRRIPHLIEYRGRLFPSLALAVAMHYWDLETRDVRVNQTEISIARAGRTLARLPLDSSGETAVNWSGGFRSLPSYSMARVLSGEVSPALFKDKIVLVGSTATGSFEWRATPFSNAQPPVELQANALDNILLNRPLHGVSGEIRFLLMLAFAIVMGALIAPRLDLGGTLWLLGGSLVLWGIALLALAKFSLYLPVAPAILAAALTYSLAMAMNYRDEWEANVRTDASVSALVRGGALVMASRNRKQLQKALCAMMREALFARATFLIIDDRWIEEQHAAENEFVQSLARAIKQRGCVAFHPTARDEKSYALDSSFGGHGLSANELSALTENGQWIAAPILSSHPHPRLRAHTGLPDSGDTPTRRTVRGVLVALGQVENRAFTARDAVVLEAIAEQAALALDVLEYAELLQGRVEWANRELREAYGVLSAQTAKFMAAVESMDEAFLICDVDHRAIFVNAAARPILREATPRLNDSIPDTLRAHGLTPVAALFDEVTGQAESLRHEYSCDDRVLAVQLTPLYESQSPDDPRNSGAARTGSMLIISDVTAQRELDEMKTNFVGFVAHEIRSPLGTIMGYAAMLQQTNTQDNPQQQAEIMAAIERQCRRMNRLVNDMLDMARLDSGHAIELRPARVPIVALCERVLQTQQTIATDLDLHFSLQCEIAGETIWGDPDRIEQILINLVSNAVKYSPSGGEIVLALTETEREIGICVSDQGMGMTPEQIENLFQKFYRTPDAKARGIKGTGLGLFLVKQLVEAHGGTIEVHSEPGQGTSFTVRLPRQINV